MFSEGDLVKFWHMPASASPFKRDIGVITDVVEEKNEVESELLQVYVAKYYYIIEYEEDNVTKRAKVIWNMAETAKAHEAARWKKNRDSRGAT